MSGQKPLTMQAKNEIADAVRLALKTIAGEAADAKHLISVDAESAAKLLVAKNADGGSDHDLLQRLDTKVDGIIVQIKEISDGTADRIRCLENEKLSAKDSYVSVYKKDVDDKLKSLQETSDKHGTNITRLIAYGTALIFLVGIAEFLISTLIRR
jgi:hypothetical protein